MQNRAVERLAVLAQHAPPVTTVPIHTNSTGGHSGLLEGQVAIITGSGQGNQSSDSKIVGPTFRSKVLAKQLRFCSLNKAPKSW